MTKEYKIDIRVKNNLLYKAMLENGYETVPKLAREKKINLNSIYFALALKIPLYSSHTKKICKIWLELSKALHRLPEDLVPVQHHNKILEKNTGSIELSARDISYLLPKKEPDQLLLKGETLKGLDIAMEYLSHKEKDIILLRFGLDGNQPQSFEKIAKKYGVSTQRAVQIHDKAISRLKERAVLMPDFQESFKESFSK